jgi:hypothetical protein
MKKKEFYSIAERMYVAEQYTFEALAAELGLAEKTLRLWAKEGNWQAKQAALVRQRSALHEDLYSFARKLVKLIGLDMDRLLESAASGDDPARDERIESRINSLSRLLDKLPKAKGYEAAVSQEKQAEEKANQAASTDVIEQKVNEILGIR